MRAIFLTLLFAASVQADTIELFRAGEGGYAMYRIPGVVVTAKGTIVAYCEARKTAADWGEIDLLVRRSTDGGKSWSAPAKFADPPAEARRNPVAVKQKLGSDAGVTMNNPVMIASRDGAVHLLYCVEYERCFYRRSGDDGVTFGAPVEITSTFDAFRSDYDWAVLATGPGHGIELRGGRLIVPVWLSTGTGGHAHRPSCVATIYSDDAGKTWQRGAIVASDPNPKNPSESAVVELSDGRVMINIRHESEPRHRAVSISPDGATNWSEIHFDAQLPDPICMASLVRLDDRRILFSNPFNAANRDRKNLTIRMSEDDGKTWPVARTLEPGPSGYSDLAVAADGSIYCFYERGTKRPTESLTFARFDVHWLTPPSP